MTEASEFWEIYKLDVVEIPTNRPNIRADGADVIYRTEREKNTAIVEEIFNSGKKGRPVLVERAPLKNRKNLRRCSGRRASPSGLHAKYPEMGSADHCASRR